MGGGASGWGGAITGSRCLVGCGAPEAGVRFNDLLWRVGFAVAQLQTERTAQCLDHRIKNFRCQVYPRAGLRHGPHRGQNGFSIGLGARGILWCKTGKQTVAQLGKGRSVAQAAISLR